MKAILNFLGGAALMFLGCWGVAWLVCWCLDEEARQADAGEKDARTVVLPVVHSQR